MSKLKLKVGDKVQVLSGKDKGKVGAITQVFAKEARVVVENINTHFRHLRSQKKGEKGQKVEFNAPVHVSNVALVDPKTSKPTRVGYKTNDKGIKVRIAKKSGQTLDK